MLIKHKIKMHDDVYWAMDSVWQMKQRKERLTRDGQVIDIPLSEKLQIEKSNFYQFVDGIDILSTAKVSDTYYCNLADNFRIAVDK